MSAYLRLLAVPRMAPLFGAMLLARLPIGINSLAIVLFLRAHDEPFSVAGAAAGGIALGSGLAAPFNARLVDRFGAKVMVLLAALHATGLLLLLGLGSSGAPPAALVASAFLAGLAMPPTSSVLRSQYPRLLGHDPALVQGAFALDSVLTELLFVAGPLLTAALVALVDPGAALVASAVAVIAGAILFVAALPATARAAPSGDRPRTSRLGALRAPGMRTLVLAMLPFGAALGAIEVALPAFADREGTPELAGVLIAVWSIASAAGGLVYGARLRRGTLAAVHLRVAVLVPITLLPLALATSPATMALLVIPAGVFVAPLIATRNELAGVVAPVGTETEAYSWPLTALVSGVALGAAAAGAIVDASGWRPAVLAAAASAGLGATVALARRSTLRAPALH